MQLAGSTLGGLLELAKTSRRARESASFSCSIDSVRRRDRLSRRCTKRSLFALAVRHPAFPIELTFYRLDSGAEA